MPDTDFGFLDNPSVTNRILQIKKAKNETEKNQFMKSFVDEIAKNLTEVTISKINDSVKIENFDEITAALRNELARAMKPVIGNLHKIKVSSEEQIRIKDAIEKQSLESIHDNLDFMFIRKPKTEVFIKNINETPIPSEISVNNLEDIKQYFDTISDVIRETFNINIPAPKVTVNAPEVRVNNPTPIVNINLDEVIDEIHSGLLRITQNSAKFPLAVRLSDGQKFINQIAAKVGSIQTALAGFSDNIRLRNNTGKIIDPAENEIATSAGSDRQTVTTGGTAVQLQSHGCRYCILTAETNNTNLVVFGGSDVVAALLTRKGVVLFTAQGSPILKVANTNVIYIDAITDTEGVSYAYFS